VQGGQVEPRLVADGLAHQGLFLHRAGHGLLDGLLVDVHQLRRLVDRQRLGVSAVSFLGQLLERVAHGGPGPLRTVAIHPQLHGQLVGGLEADAADVVGQPVGVLLDLGDGLLAVGAIDADRAGRAEPVIGEEEHDAADLALLLPALADHLQALAPDAADVEKEVGILVEHLQGPLLVDADDAGGQRLADAADRARAQVALDAVEGGGMGGADLLGLELTPVLPVDHPLARGLDVLPLADRGDRADHRREVAPPLDLHLEHGEPAFRVVEGHALNQAGDLLGHASALYEHSYPRAGRAKRGCSGRSLLQPPPYSRARSWRRASSLA